MATDMRPQPTSLNSIPTSRPAGYVAKLSFATLPMHGQAICTMDLTFYASELTQSMWSSRQIPRIWQDCHTSRQRETCDVIKSGQILGLHQTGTPKRKGASSLFFRCRSSLDCDSQLEHSLQHHFDCPIVWYVMSSTMDYQLHECNLAPTRRASMFVITRIRRPR